MNDKNNASREFVITQILELARSYNEGSVRFGIEKNEELWLEMLVKLTKTERDNFMEWIKEHSDQLRKRSNGGLTR